jgi:predicted amidophosphoribosyltransferase
MATLKVEPQKIAGSWTEGRVLDFHSVSSTLLGYDEYGHPIFETERTEAGEHVYRLKYRADIDALPPLVDAASALLAGWAIVPSVVVPVPPTNTDRRVQPVFLLARALGEDVDLPVREDAIQRTKRYAELKNVHDPEERRRLLDGAFEVRPEVVSGQRILLVDDLYRSGATMNAISEALMAAGSEAVYAFALTMTRSRR